MADDNFYPIDQSTATEADSGWNDAALLSQLAYAPNTVGFVVQGLSFSVDFAASPPLLTVETGWARLAAPQGQTLDHSGADPAGPPPKTVLDQVYPTQVARRSGIELTTNSENYVYLTGNRGAADDLGYVVKTADNRPDPPSLLVGTVDTTNETVDGTINRLPDGEFSDLRAESEPTDPTDVARLADIDQAATGDHDHSGDTLGDDDAVTIMDGEYGPITRMTTRASRSAVYGFTSPQANYIAEQNTTFVVYRGRDADPYATAYDHETHSWSKHTRVGANPLPNDDSHGVPGSCIDDNGIIHVMFGAHNDFGGPIQYARSDAPYDTSSWTVRDASEIPVGTYTSAEVVAGDVYFLYRTGPGHVAGYPSHEYSTLVRATGGTGDFVDIGPITDMTGVPEAGADSYTSDLDARDGNLHVTWTIARNPNGGHGGTRTGIYHAYYDPDDGAMHAADGTALGIPATWGDIDSNGLVEITANPDVNVPRHALHPDGSIAITYSQIEADGTANWYLAEWSGNGWTTEQLAETTRAGNYAEARWNDDGELEVVMAVGKTVDGDATEFAGANRGGSLARWTRVDGAWNQEILIPEQDGFSVARAACVRDGPDEFAALATEERPSATDWDASLYAIGATRGSPSTARRAGDYPTDPNRSLVQTAKADAIPTGADELLNFKTGDPGTPLGLKTTGSGFFALFNGFGGGAALLGTGNTRFLARPDGTCESGAGFVSPEEDLSQRAGLRDMETMNHDGADGSPRGKYVWWASDGLWHKVGDEQTTTI